MDKNAMKQSYDSILKLYDCAEDIIGAVEEAPEDHIQAALKAAEPVITQLESTASILSESFITFGETGEKLNAHNKNKAEGSIQKLYATLSVFCEQLGEVLLDAAIDFTGDIRNQILALKQKVKRKFGERMERLFSIMLWVGDYMKKLASKLEQVGLGITAALAVPLPAPMAAITSTGRSVTLQTMDQTRGWSL